MNGSEAYLSSACFVDSNIWLYAFIEAQHPEKTRIAKQIIEQCEIWLSSQVINELCVNLIKKAGFSEPDIIDLISSIYNRYTVTELSQDTLTLASRIRHKSHFSFWDSMIAASAMESGVQVLLTEDMQNGFVLENSVTLINPFSNQQF
jgi:predicted nucleic acid-binding protein